MVTATRGRHHPSRNAASYVPICPKRLLLAGGLGQHFELEQVGELATSVSALHRTVEGVQLQTWIADKCKGARVSVSMVQCELHLQDYEDSGQRSCVKQQLLDKVPLPSHTA